MSIVLRHKDEDGVEFFTLDSTGESGMSISDFSRLCGKPRTSVGEAIERGLRGEGALGFLSEAESVFLARTGEAGKNRRLIQKEICEAILRCFYTQGTLSQEGCNAIRLPFISGRIAKDSAADRPESIVRDRLQGAVGGHIEVALPVGRIDLLTDTELIEVKQAVKWKAGIGQLIVYGHYYPQHSLRLHLFGVCSSELLSLIVEACYRLNITVSQDGGS